MIPRQGRVAVRQTAQQAPQPQYQAYSFPGPSLGWVSDQNLAVSQPGAAYILENIFPTATGGILRRGCAQQADLATAEILNTLTGTISTTAASATVTGDGTGFESELEVGDTIKIDGVNYTIDAIASDTSLTLTEIAASTLSGEDLVLVTNVYDPTLRALFSYENGNDTELFAGVDGAIFDCSVQGNPDYAYTVSDGYFSVAQYTSTDGTRYARGVNGVDVSWVYDGTDFSTTPALTFASPDGSNTSDILDFTWVYRNRFLFIQKNSFTIWYLPVGQIGGELTRFDLGGEFKLGGKLIFGGTWSIESGDGLQSMCVFFSDKGEVAVYQGSNPGDAADWLKVGVYYVGKPKGPKSFAYRGGDIAIATDIGFVLLSGALQKDATQVALTALSAPIENEWRGFSELRITGDWPVEFWSEGQMLTIALPTGPGEDPIWLVANARTNKWCPFKGWEATCQQVHNGRLYFGTKDGRVCEANTGGSDDGAPYTGVYLPVFDQLGQPGLKTAHMARQVIRSPQEAMAQISVQQDFVVQLPTSPDAAAVEGENQWGSGQWGTAVWGGSGARTVQQGWQNVFGEGEVIAIGHQITSGETIPLDTEFIRTDVLFTTGEMQS